MARFFRERGLWLDAVVIIMFAISLVQGGISYTMAYGGLSGLVPKDRSAITTVLVAMRFVLVALMAALWALNRKRALFRLIVVANALFTFALLVHTSTLISVLFGGASGAVNALMLDVVLMATANILIFSVWYWIVDPPGVEEIPRADERWDFLFPQRGSPLPHYESWVPLCGLPVRCLHDELRLQPDRHAAADAARKDAHDASGGDFRGHADRGGGQRDQHPGRREMTGAARLRPAGATGVRSTVLQGGGNV